MVCPLRLLPIIIVDQAGNGRRLFDLSFALPVGVVLLDATAVEFRVWPLRVVICDVIVNDLPERRPAEEETVGQAFVLNLPHKLLRVVIHDRRSGRDDLRQNADPGKIPVHFLRITPVAVADQKADVGTEGVLAVAGPPFDRVHEPLRGAVLRSPGDEHPLRLQMDEEQCEEGPLAVVGPDLCGEEVARPRDLLEPLEKFLPRDALHDLFGVPIPDIIKGTSINIFLTEIPIVSVGPVTTTIRFSLVAKCRTCFSNLLQMPRLNCGVWGDILLM